MWTLSAARGLLRPPRPAAQSSKPSSLPRGAIVVARGGIAARDDAARAGAARSPESRPTLDLSSTRSMKTSACRRSSSAIIGGWLEMVEITVTRTMNFVPGKTTAASNSGWIERDNKVAIVAAFKLVLPLTHSLAAALNFQESGPLLKEDDFQIVWEDAQASAVSRKGRRGSRFQLKYRKQPHAK